MRSDSDPHAVPARSASTRERIVTAARDLFLERGFQATSLQDIARRAGANPGSLYYFFKTKEELLCAVLDWYLQNLGPEILEPAFAASTDPLARIFAILDGYRQMLLVSEFNVGCPIGNLAIEVAPFLESARTRIVANFELWKTAIEECLHALPAPPGVDHAGLASLVLTTMEGAVLQARAYRSIEPYEVSVRALRDYLERIVQPAGGADEANAARRRPRKHATPPAARSRHP